MANFGSLAKKRFGTPPAPDAVRGNLAAPEIAPAAPTAPQPPAGERKTRKKTGRTVLFSTRVSEQFDTAFRAAAERDNLLLTRLLELAFAAYEREKNR
jgi:hypothetical protein